MKQYLKFLIGAVFTASGVSLAFLLKMAPSPEATTSLIWSLPAFVVFLLFLFAIICIGAFFRHLLLRKAQATLSALNGWEMGLVDIAMGSVFLYLLAFTLTPFRLFQVKYFVLLWFMLGVGVTFGLSHQKIKSLFSTDCLPQSKLARIPFLLLPLLLLIKALEGLQFHQHGDAYLTYLPAPRSWAETGGFDRYLDFTQFFLSTSYETMFAWGTALMGLDDGRGLDLTQQFSQWCIGVLAVLGLILGLLSLCSRLSKQLPVAIHWFPVIVISALHIPALRWTMNLPKHDFGVAFWGVSAFYFILFLLPHSAGFALAAGLILGATVIGKLTLATFAIVLGIWVIISFPKRAPVFIVGGIIGVLPVFLRNYFVTGSPVFPWMPKLFPTPYLSASTVLGAENATSKVISLPLLGDYSIELMQQVPLFVGVLLLVIWTMKNRAMRPIIWLPIWGVTVFTFVFRPSTEIRYQGAGIIIFALLAAYGCLHAIERIKSRRVSFSLSTLCAIGMITISSMTFFTLFQIGPRKFPPVSNKIETIPGGEAKFWIRSNLKKSDSILDVGDMHIFYIMDFNVTEMIQSVKWDPLMDGAPTAVIVDRLKKVPFDYMYFTAENENWHQIAQAREILKAFSDWNQTCKRFDFGPSQVWDMKCLQN